MIDWPNIDTLLLDMDGTLLDQRFDNVLWNELLPERYAAHHGLAPAEAAQRIDAYCRRTQHTLAFYCLDQWAAQTQLDIMALHRELVHLICYRAEAEAFLQRHGTKRLVLVTNAHRGSLSLKDETTGLCEALHGVFSAHDLAAPKESAVFWRRLAEIERFDPERTLLIDDNDTVLAAARSFGIRHLLTVSQPDSGQPQRSGLEFPAFNSFAELLP